MVISGSGTSSDGNSSGGGSDSWGESGRGGSLLMSVDHLLAVVAL